jgi:L-aspartate oxidase
MIVRWQRYVLVRQFSDNQGWELQNMLTVARMMVRAAMAREESRGVHFRTDFPTTDDHRWRRRLSFGRYQPDPVQVPLNELQSGDKS